MAGSVYMVKPMWPTFLGGSTTSDDSAFEWPRPVPSKVPTGTRRPGSSRLVLAASLVRRDRGGRDWFFGFTVDEFDPCRLSEVFLSSKFLGLGDD